MDDGSSWPRTDLTDAVLAGVQHLLADRPGGMLVSDTNVSRPEYFR